MHILSWIYVVVAVVLLFGLTVFVHEFGHFWVARWRGLKVESFSIGFGPKLFSWTRHGIEYAWRAIPAGGSLALPQMTSGRAADNQVQELPPVPAGSTILVALAGPAMNLLGFLQARPLSAGRPLSGKRNCDMI